MTQFVALPPRLPALVAAGGEHASMCFLEFFAANIRNSHTRLADRRRSARSRPDRAHGQFLRPDRRGAWVAVEDVFTQNRRLWYRLREKGGKRHAMPCHHILEEYLIAYLDGAGRRCDTKAPLFRTMGRGTGQLTRTVRPQANAYATIRRRAAPAGVE